MKYSLILTAGVVGGLAVMQVQAVQAQGCPPNSAPVSEQNNVVHCRCVSGFENRGGVCVPTTVSAKPAITEAPPKALGWEAGHPDREAWSRVLREDIKNHLAQLEKAEDIKQFFPNYDRLSEAERVDAWAHLFVEIARIESDTTSKKRDGTPFDPDALGDYGKSIGLFQLSYINKDFYGLDLDPTGKDWNRSLHNPVVNIRCAVQEFAWLVDRWHVIAYQRNDSGAWVSSKQKNGARGAAMNWSTLWDQPRKDKGGKAETPYLTLIRNRLQNY